MEVKNNDGYIEIYCPACDQTIDYLLTYVRNNEVHCLICDELLGRIRDLPEEIRDLLLTV